MVDVYQAQRKKEVYEVGFRVRKTREKDGIFEKQDASKSFPSLTVFKQKLSIEIQREEGPGDY